MAVSTNGRLPASAERTLCLSLYTLINYSYQETTTNKIRISAATLTRIELDGRILVALNNKRLLAGKKVYTPFGGALEFHEQAKPFLESLNAVFENGNDLRLTIAEDKLPAFEEWFNQKKDRETPPYRELREELVDEEKVFSALPENKITLEYIAGKAERAVSDRPGQAGTITQRYFEVFKAKLSPTYELTLKLALAKPDSPLALVTEQEILAGKSESGTEIGSNCIPLICKQAL